MRDNKDRTRYRTELQSLYRLVVDREMRMTDFKSVHPSTVGPPAIPEETVIAPVNKTHLPLNR